MEQHDAAIHGEGGRVRGMERAWYSESERYTVARCARPRGLLGRVRARVRERSILRCVIGEMLGEMGDGVGGCGWVTGEQFY